MNLGHIVSLVLFSIGLALYNPLPFVSGVFVGVAAFVALCSDDDEDDDNHRGHKQPRTT